MHTVPDSLEIASKKIIDKATEATVELIGNKIADRIVRLKHVIHKIARYIEEIIIPTEREEILNK